MDPTAASTADAQAATLQQFIKAWTAWDAAAWIDTFSTDDFQQVTLPFSMGVPPRNRQQVEHTLPVLVSLVKDYELNIRHVLHDAERGKAALYATSTGKTPWGPWAMEYAVFLTFTTTGHKVAQVEEMLDPVFMQWFAPKFQQHLAQSAHPADP